MEQAVTGQALAAISPEVWQANPLAPYHTPPACLSCLNSTTLQGWWRHTRHTLMRLYRVGHSPDKADRVVIPTISCCS